MANLLASLIISSLLLSSGLNFLIWQNNSGDLAAGPTRLTNKNLGIQTSAKSILIIDDQSKSILYEKNTKEALPLASITKLITALVILDTKPDWNRVIKISKEDQRDGGIVYFFSGEEAKLKDVFNVMLVASSNEAALALARNSGITDFTLAMNKKAAALGMNDSYFFDPSGLDPQNVSSANDLIKLAETAFKAPEIVQAVTASEYQYKILNKQRNNKAVNTDQLLDSFLNQGEYKILGAKTGHLDEAGYCLLLKIKKNSGQSITLALFGAQTINDRWQEAKGLIDWVFRNYQW
jgi:D-alanyl-D-alanine carboxypeptidase